MSQQDKSKTPTATIKIAAKDASQRGSGGTADPGPGDPNAMPSEMPEPVSIPAAPTPSELVVKTAKSGTTNSRVIRTINDPVSLPKSRGSSASRALTSPKSHPGSKEPIDEGQPQPTEGARSGSRSATRSSAKSVASSGGGGGGKAGSGAGPSGGQADSLPRSGTGSVGTGPMGSKRQSVGAVKTLESAGGAGGGGEPEPAGPSASQAMQADSQVGQEHDVVEDGETEIEHPSPSPSPSQAQDEAGPSAGPSAGNKQSGPSSPGVGSSPASSGGGSPKMGPKTSGRKSKKTSDKDSDASDASGVSGSGKKKKMTKFRYHKRVTVRTHGKKDPTAVMDRVNLKDHKAGITPSSIGEMDPEELMKRAGIKGNKNTHWRVRLRQTKRTTKDGKTTTETKVAYRDSEGNKRIKTSSTPNCQKCNKKLEDCKCD